MSGSWIRKGGKKKPLQSQTHFACREHSVAKLRGALLEEMMQCNIHYPGFQLGILISITMYRIRKAGWKWLFFFFFCWSIQTTKSGTAKKKQTKKNACLELFIQCFHSFSVVHLGGLGRKVVPIICTKTNSKNANVSAPPRAAMWFIKEHEYNPNQQLKMSQKHSECIHLIARRVSWVSR